MLFGGTKRDPSTLCFVLLAGSAGWHCYVTRGMPEMLSSKVPRLLLQ